MIQTLVLFFIMALLAEVLGTIGGFGSSVFFVPLAGFFYNFESVLVITSILHVFSNTSKLFLFRKEINYSLLLWLGIPSVIMVIVGAELTTHIKFKYTEMILGIFLVVISSLLYFFPKLRLSQRNGVTISAGGLAGFFAGFIGTGGAIRGLSLAAFNLTKEVFVATSAAIDFGVDLSRSVIYLNNRFLEKEQYFMVPILLVIAFLGSYLGKRALNKISTDNFRKIVLMLLLIIGVIQIVKAM